MMDNLYYLLQLTALDHDTENNSFLYQAAQIYQIFCFSKKVGGVLQLTVTGERSNVIGFIGILPYLPSLHFKIDRILSKNTTFVSDSKQIEPIEIKRVPRRKPVRKTAAPAAPKTFSRTGSQNRKPETEASHVSRCAR